MLVSGNLKLKLVNKFPNKIPLSANYSSPNIYYRKCSNVERVADLLSIWPPECKKVLFVSFEEEIKKARTIASPCSTGISGLQSQGGCYSKLGFLSLILVP